MSWSRCPAIEFWSARTHEKQIGLIDLLCRSTEHPRSQKSECPPVTIIAPHPKLAAGVNRVPLLRTRPYDTNVAQRRDISGSTYISAADGPQAKSPRIISPPNPDSAVGLDGKGKVFTRSNAYDAIQIRYPYGRKSVGTLSSVSDFPIRVITPAPNIPVRTQSERMFVSACNRNNIGQAQHIGYSSHLRWGSTANTEHP